jgi:hypothetical protein
MVLICGNFATTRLAKLESIDAAFRPEYDPMRALVWRDDPGSPAPRYWSTAKSVNDSNTPFWGLGVRGGTWTQSIDFLVPVGSQFGRVTVPIWSGPHEGSSPPNAVTNVTCLWVDQPEFEALYTAPDTAERTLRIEHHLARNWRKDPYEPCPVEREYFASRRDPVVVARQRSRVEAALLVLMDLLEGEDLTPASVLGGETGTAVCKTRLTWKLDYFRDNSEKWLRKLREAASDNSACLGQKEWRAVQKFITDTPTVIPSKEERDEACRSERSYQAKAAKRKHKYEATVERCENLRALIGATPGVADHPLASRLSSLLVQIKAANAPYGEDGERRWYAVDRPIGDWDDEFIEVFSIATQMRAGGFPVPEWEFDHTDARRVHERRVAMMRYGKLASLVYNRFHNSRSIHDDISFGRIYWSNLDKTDLLSVEPAKWAMELERVLKVANEVAKLGVTVPEYLTRRHE